MLYALLQFCNYNPDSVKTHCENTVRKKYCILVLIFCGKLCLPKILMLPSINSSNFLFWHNC